MTSAPETGLTVEPQQNKGLPSQGCCRGHHLKTPKTETFSQLLMVHKPSQDLSPLPEGPNVLAQPGAPQPAHSPPPLVMEPLALLHQVRISFLHHFHHNLLMQLPFQTVVKQPSATQTSSSSSSTSATVLDLLSLHPKLPPRLRQTFTPTKRLHHRQENVHPPPPGSQALFAEAAVLNISPVLKKWASPPGPGT